jgi:monovalent cation:H+ antiporter, CPA1 family
VLYRAIGAAVLVGAGATSLTRIAAIAVAGAILGAALGVVLAYVIAFALRAQIGAGVQSLATFVGAYGAYYVAERMHWSGIFAVIAFGIALRELERRRISVALANGVGTFWEVAAATANIALFFMTGAALDFTRLAHTAPAAGVAIAGVLISRIVVAYGLLAILRSQVRLVWRAVVRMAGIRGALSLALALALPQTFAARATIVDATFAVVVVTILAGTLTLDRRLSQMQLDS